jgi:hypothetical protein
MTTIVSERIKLDSRNLTSLCQARSVLQLPELTVEGLSASIDVYGIEKRNDESRRATDAGEREARGVLVLQAVQQQGLRQHYN